MRGSFPSFVRKPPFIETPISVPSVSKRSTKKNANMTTKKSSPLTSAQPVFGSPLCVQPAGSNTAQKVCLNCANESAMPANVRTG